MTYDNCEDGSESRRISRGCLPIHGAGFQPLSLLLPQSWGFAPGWNSIALSALKYNFSNQLGSAKGAPYISLGRSPRTEAIVTGNKGLKARTIASFETPPLDPSDRTVAYTDGSGEAVVTLEIKTPGLSPAFPVLREKARMPRAVHGDEWPQGVWGHVPPF